jgi:hypothetical protein
MESRLHQLVARIKELEKELAREIQKKEEEYYYKIFGKKVTFEEWIKHEQKALVQKIIPYIRESSWPVILSAPVIWAVLPAALLFDLMLTIYQAICFPIYGIPRVKRVDHFLFDRRVLPYLNIIEKLNCEYCAYVNGLIAYAQEIVGRTEQYWCPIKHARKMTTLHRRYISFLEYGDGEGYRKRLEAVRRDFTDLRGEQDPPAED